jgi:hypothetical protein
MNGDSPHNKIPVLFIFPKSTSPKVQNPIRMFLKKIISPSFTHIEDHHTKEAYMELAVADEGRSTKMETQPPRSLGTTCFITSWKLWATYLTSSTCP